jgi:fructokinase
MATVESVGAQTYGCIPGDPGVTAGDELIAVAGEALVDLLLEPGGHTKTHLGGGAFNAARTLGRLGLRPLFVGRLSRDENGRSLRRGLEESGVRLDGIIETDDPTTFARVELDGRGSASYRFYIEGTSVPGLLASDARGVMPRAPAAMHVGGLGLVFEPQASAIAGLVSDAAPSTLILVDPNCRPAAVRDARAYRRRLQAVLSRADVVKVSDDDLSFLEPDLPPSGAARRLLDMGPSVVLLSHGARGASVLTAARAAHIEPVPTTVMDTIGAGDAFGAAWLGAWVTEGLRRVDLPYFDATVRAARFAAVIAARTCERAGAEPPRAARVGAEWCVVPAGAGGIGVAE